MRTLLLGNVLLLAVFLQAPETQLEVNTPPTTDAITLEISPDGDKILITGDSAGKRQLWVHSLTSGTARPLAGTDDVANPFPCWSPDGRSIAYFGPPSTLKRIELETAAVRTLANFGEQIGRGCTWSRDGTILFSLSATRPILRISDEGGSIQAATPPDPLYYQSPRFLPDSRHFLFFAPGGVHVSELAGDSAPLLVAADSAAVYSPSGHILFLRQGTLYAQRFDPGELKLSGEPFVVAERVPNAANVPAVSSSAAGHLVYRTGGGGNLRYFKWFDRTGKETGSVGEGVGLAAGAPALSPDGLTLALNITIDGNQDVWLLDIATGKLTRLTSHPTNDGFPVWSHDGKSVYFAASRSGIYELYQKAVSSKPDEEAALVLRTAGLRLPRDLSSDGRFLLFRSAGQIYFAQLDGNPPGEFALQTFKNFAQFSPDGRWVADQADDSGRFEVYIQQFPSGRKLQVSTSGGGHVRWGPDGKEVFFISADGKLMSASVEFSADGQEAKVGTPAELFTPSLIPNIISSGFAQQYVVSRDGKRFLIATAAKVESPIKVIRNWQAAVKN